MRLSSFDWDSILDCEEVLAALPEKIKVEAETMETFATSTKGKYLTVPTQFYGGTDLGSIPLFVDEGHEVISESSAELNALLASIRMERMSALIVSAALTQESVTYEGAQGGSWQHALTSRNAGGC